jgi:hypothetical protein
VQVPDIPDVGHVIVVAALASICNVAVGVLLSSDTFALTVNPVVGTLAPLAGDVMAIVGGLFTAGPTVTETCDGVEFCVPSLATAVSVCVPLPGVTFSVQTPDVPDGGHVMEVAALASTCSVAVGVLWSSATFALTVKVEGSPVAPLAGDVMDMVGGLLTLPPPAIAAATSTNGSIALVPSGSPDQPRPCVQLPAFPLVVRSGHSPPFCNACFT